MAVSVPSHSPDRTPERPANDSKFDRVFNAVRAGWSDDAEDPEASREAQARFARRIGGDLDFITIQGETWQIMAVNNGDAHDPVIIGREKSLRVIPALLLDRIEESSALIDVDAPTPEPRRPVVVPTGARTPATPAKTKTRLSLRYGAGDISDSTEDIILDDVDASFHTEKKDAGLWDKIFKHNLAFQEYRQRRVGALRKRVLATGNTFVGRGLSREDHAKATGAMVDRLIFEHEEALQSVGPHGEQRTELGKKGADGKKQYSAQERLVCRVVACGTAPAGGAVPWLAARPRWRSQ